MSKSPAEKNREETPSRPDRRTHRERVDLSDRLMLDAAEALIIEVGTRNTTLKEVGERAGYSRGLAHARFGSKETLFLRLADRCRQLWIEELQRVAGDSQGLAAFMSRIDAIASYVDKYPAEARVMYILWFESVGSTTAMHEGLSRFHDQAREDIRRLIEAAATAGEITATVDASRFAVQFCATFFGFCYQWLVNPAAVDLASQIEDFKQQMSLVLRPSG